MTSLSDASPGISVVLGGTGAIGGAVVRELVSLGRRVRVVSRSGRLPFGVRSGDAPQTGAAVEAVSADITDPEAVARVTEGAAVVYQATQPDYTRWSMEFSLLTRAVLDGVAAAGARPIAKLVVVDNLYMYGDTHGAPLTESTPYAATDRKGRVRAAMARELLAAHESGKVRVTLGRPASYYGPGGRQTDYGAQVFGPALAGAPAQWIGPLDVLQTMSYLPDIARALVVLADSDTADGRAWHLPHAGALTGDQFLRLVYAAAGSLSADSPDAERGYAVQAADRAALPYIARANPEWAGFLAEIEDIYHRFEVPYLVETTAFEGAFGPFEVTPHGRAVASTVDWFRAGSPRDTPG